MNVESMLKDLATYNLWANQRLVDWAKAQSEESLTQTVASSFASARQTFVHIWETETSWLCILRNVPNERGWNTPYEGTAMELFADVLQRSTELVDYVHALSEAEFEQTRHYNFPWLGEIDRQHCELIQHCLNHSTYHRGQVVTIGHQLGWTAPPTTDYFFYLMQNGRA